MVLRTPVIIILKRQGFLQPSWHRLFRLPCRKTKFSNMSLECINSDSGPAGTMQPLPQPSTSGNSCPVTPPSKKICPSIGLHRKNPSLPPRPLLLLPAVATLPETAVSSFRRWWLRWGRALSPPGEGKKKNGSVNPTSTERGRGTKRHKNHWVLLLEHIAGGGPFGVGTLPPNPLVCLCILLWETHSVKPSFPPSHLPQRAGPADLLMMV
ncbi:hypothetical protein E2320_006284 [Naja naja]|nr:hypothetical protein E2320_006284 [Naja naja]